MKLLEELLLETRRIYKRLPNISAYKELEPYKDKDDYYISFTDIEKLGIYPQSQFRTPLGIYMYPLKEAWAEYNVDANKEIGKSVPFAGNRPHIWLVKLKSGVKFVDKASKYTEDDLSKDLTTLRIHVMKNKEMYYKSFGLESPNELTIKVLQDKFDEWAMKAKLGSIPITRLWNITRNLAFRGRNIDDADTKERTSVITNWNTLFYKVLGYYGFADKEGKGYIHEFEPIQAVFFTKLAFDVISLTPNKESNEIESSWLIDAINKKKIKVKNTKIKYDTEQKILHWYKGDWMDGIWKNGAWHYGTWYNGTWEDGWWINGTWRNGIWKSGKWQYGFWLNGDWYDGRWNDGVWEDGTWHDGRWYDGIWKGGVWKKGKIYDDFKKGNFKPNWKWDDYGYVESPISPAEYFKKEKSK